MQGQARAAFIASGGLWRVSPADLEMRRAQNNAMLETQRRIDAMSEEELDALVQQMNAVGPPTRLQCMEESSAWRNPIGGAIRMHGIAWLMHG